MLYIEEYSKYLKNSKRSAASTIQSYLRDIKKFEEYIKKIKVDCLKVTKQIIVTFLIHMQKNGQATSSILRMAASLRSYYGFLCEKCIIIEDPALNIEAPKLPKRDFQVLTAKETETLLMQPECVNFKGYRDKAMLELLYATGIKVSEIIELTIDDVKLEEGYITCGSANKARMVPIGMIAAKALGEYLNNARFKNLDGFEGNSYLFINLNGGKLSRQGFWKIVKYYKQKAKINKEITPNTLRHSFAVHLMENGADVVSVKEMLGHTALSSTKVYSNMVNKRINDVYKKAHPRA